MIDRYARAESKAAAGIYDAMGEIVRGYLQERDVTDITLNPPVLDEKHGRIAVCRLGKPKEFVGFMNADQATHFIGLVASSVNSQVTISNPSIKAKLSDGNRFQGAIPPTSAAPFFSIRRHASAIIKQQTYVELGQMSERQRLIIRDALTRRLNILIVGGTGAGKTTMLMSMLDEAVLIYPEDRIYVVEDTAEIRCNALDLVMTQTSPGRTIRDLVQEALRNNPKRILIGETRGPEMLDILMAWNTGHDGGMATIHSNIVRPEAALERVEDLVLMATGNPMQRMIARTINMIICISHDPIVHRRVTQIVTVHGYDRSTETYQLTSET